MTLRRDFGYVESGRNAVTFIHLFKSCPEVGVAIQAILSRSPSPLFRPVRASGHRLSWYKFVSLEKRVEVIAFPWDMRCAARHVPKGGALKPAWTRRVDAGPPRAQGPFYFLVKNFTWIAHQSWGSPWEMNVITLSPWSQGRSKEAAG